MQLRLDNSTPLQIMESTMPLARRSLRPMPPDPSPDASGQSLHFENRNPAKSMKTRHRKKFNRYTLPLFSLRRSLAKSQKRPHRKKTMSRRDAGATEANADPSSQTALCRDDNVRREGPSGPASHRRDRLGSKRKRRPFYFWG